MGRTKKWFCKHAGKERGPYTSREIREMVRTGDVLACDQLWKEGMADWLPAERFPKLFKRVGRRRYSGPSGKLMGLAGLLLVFSIVASPFSELTQGLTGSVNLVCLIVCGLLFIGSVVAFAMSLFGIEQQRLVVPTEGRLVRRALVGSDEEPSPGGGVESESHPNRAQEGAWPRSMSERTAPMRRSSGEQVGRQNRSTNVRLQLAVATLVVFLGGGIMTLYLTAEPPAVSGPYSYHPVSGQVVGARGKPLIGRPMLLRFTPENGVDPAAVVVPPGLAAVNPKTGRFRAMIAAAREGKSRMWRVAVLALDEQALPAEFLPLVYSDSATTPVIVELGKGDITIELPTHQ